MKKILNDAAAVGNATARAVVFKSRQKDTYLYPNSAWFTCFIGGSYEFLSQPGVRDLDERVHFISYASGVTPAMALERVGLGSQYAAAATDSEGKPLDGAKTYKIHLPPNIPAKGFWSFVAYDNQTRSMLQTDQQFPSIGSLKKELVVRLGRVHVIDRARRVRDLGPFRGRSPQKGFDVGGDGRHGAG